MGVFKDKGIVLKEYRTGERDKNLVLLLKSAGKVTVFAKGANNPKSKFGASAQLFALSEFVIFEGRGFLSLTQCECIENFHAVRNGFEALCYASHILELLDKTLLPGMDSGAALRLACLSLRALAGGKPPGLAAAAFELKLLQAEGLTPVTGFCAECRKTVGGAVFFGEQGVVCNECSATAATGPTVRLSPAAVSALEYILNAGTSNFLKFSLSDSPLKELLSALKIFRAANIQAVFRSVELLETVE